MLSLRTLGELELREDGQIRLGGRRKPLALLAYLLRASPRSASRDALATLLWGDRGEERSRQSLRQTLSELRGVLGDALVADTSEVAVSITAVQVDVAEFEDDCAKGNWRSGLARWGGEFLPGAEDLGEDEWRTWLEVERETLRKKLAMAFRRAGDELERRADWGGLLELATTWEKALPRDEQGCLRAISALRALGRPADAAAHHADFLKRLKADGVLEPSSELVRVGGLLEHETSLRARRDPGARALMSPDLVGRGREFQVLSEAWHNAKRSRDAGVVVVITGPDGLGKSRLCQEFVRYVRRERAPAVVVEARAFATERATPYAVLRPVLDQLADAPGLLAAPPAALSSLAAVSERWRARLPHVSAGSPDDQVASSFHQAISEIAVESPTLIVIDDAPDADNASVAALATLVRRPPAHVLLIVTGRSDAWDTSPLGSDIERLGQHGRRLELEPLDESDTLTMLASMAPLTSEHATRLAGRLHREAGGNPAQLTLMARHLADAGILAPDATGHWAITREFGDEELAHTRAIRSAVEERVARLDDRARRLLEAAAVCGPRCDDALVESVAGLEPEQFRAALGDLLSVRLLRASVGSTGASHLEFPGEATRRAVYDDLAPSRRRELHAAAYRLLRAQPDRWPAALIEHHRLAGEAPGDAGVRRRWLATASVVGVAAVIAIVFVSQRSPSRVGQGTPVLLADVENLTGDSLLDRSLYAAASVALQESRQVGLIPRNRVRETLRLMERSKADSFLNESVAREVALRQGVSRLVLLSISRFDNAYLLSGRLVEPVSGRDLFDDRERATSRSDILTGLDRLVIKLRRALGEPGLTRATAENALPQATTSSLEALRAYADGLRAWDRRDYQAAGDLYHRAVGIDSGFALAHAALAEFYFVRANNPALAESSLARAKQAWPRLSEREQLVLSIQAARLHGPEFEEARLSELMARGYPSRETWYSLGTTLMRQRHCDAAIPALRQALVFDSTFVNARINLATCRQFLGDYAGAVEEYVQARRIDSTVLVHGTLNYEWGHALLRTRGPAAAESAFRLMLTQLDPLDRGYGLRSLGYLAMYRGQYQEAVRYFDSGAVYAAQSHANLSVWRDQILSAEASLTLGDTTTARKLLRQAYDERQNFQIDASWFLVHAHALVRAHLLDLARETAKAAASALGSGRAVNQSAVALIDGDLLLAAGKYRDALDRLARVQDTIYVAWTRMFRADAFVALGATDSALVEVRPIANGMYFGYEVEDDWLRSMYRLGQLAERTGDRSGAVKAYRAYVDRWAVGDSVLPELRAARAAIARLTSGDSATAHRVPTKPTRSH